MAIADQQRRAVLERLRAGQEGSQGRVGVGQISELERAGRGLVRGITAPLDVVGLAVEPSYGPGGPGVAGTIGELAGSIAPYLLAEVALARYVPLLRGRGLLPSATRAATGFGVVEFGRAPQGQETRAGNAVSGALQGAIIGATSGGSLLKAGLGGAAATAVPLALGQEVGSPVPITGNETADALIFNSALAMGFQAIGRRLSSDAPPPEASEAGAPGTVPPPPSRPPITDPTRLLRPRTFYQPPAPTDVVEGVVAGWRERRVPARAAVRTAVDEVKMHLDEDPLYVPGPETLAIPEVASYYERVRKLRSQVGMSTAMADILRPAEPTQLELPGVRERLEQFELAGKFVRPSAWVGPFREGDVRTKIKAELIRNAPSYLRDVSIKFGDETAHASAVMPINGVETAVSFPIWPGESLERSLQRNGIPIPSMGEFALPRARGEKVAPIEPSKLGPYYPTEPGPSGVRVGDPPLQRGYTRLYRGEAPPSTIPPPDWVREGLERSGAKDAQGRWFTDRRDIAEWYAFDAGSGGRVRFVDLPTEEAEAFRVTKNPAALRFSRDPEREFFLPPHLTGKSATGPLVQLVRSADEQASLEAKALELKTSARVTAGRTIALDDVTASSMPEGLAGFDKASGTINTAGLGLDDLNRLIDEAKIAGDNGLAQTLTRTQAGLAGRGKKKGVVGPAKERKSAAVASQVVEKAKATELSPEELLLRREDDSLYGETPTLEAHVELTERRIIEVESGDILPGEMAYKSKRFVGDLDRIKQGRSGDTYTYANMLRALKDMHTPMVGVDGANFKIAMPNETIVTMTREQVEAHIAASLPLTDVVPVFRGADASPAAQPLVRDSREWQQLNLPGVDADRTILEALRGFESPYEMRLREALERSEVRPIPEPSEAVVLKSAERESVVQFPPKPKVAEYLEAVERLQTLGIPFTSHAETGHSVKGEIAVNPTDFVRKAKKAMGLPPDKPFENLVTDAGKAAKQFQETIELADLQTVKENLLKAFPELHGITPALTPEVPISPLLSSAEQAQVSSATKREQVASIVERLANVVHASPAPADRQALDLIGQINRLFDAQGQRIGAPTVAKKPTTVTLRPTKAKIDKFLEERGIVGTYERLPNRHKASFVKGEAASKAIEVDISPQGVVVTDKVSGKRTKVKTLKEAAKIVADSPNNEGPMRSADELRSLFRRRFAAAKSQAERNNIRKKYALYADYMDATPLRPGETPLDTLGNLINRRVPPTVNLDPPSAGGAGRINLPPDPPPTIPGGGPTISDTIPFSEISGMGWRRYFEPMKFWSLELEKRSGGIIPAYTRVFAPLDEARQEMQVFLSGYYPDLVKAWKPFKADTAARERITSYLEAPDKAAAIREHGISPSEVKAAGLLRGMWNKLYKELGYEDNLEFIENYVPWRRLNRELSERDAMDMFYKNRAKPKSYIVGQELERETNGEWVRERDAFKLFHDYLFRGARKQFVADPHADAVKLVNEMSMPSNTESTRKHLVNFVDRMWGTTDASNKALNDFVDGLFQRLGVYQDKQFKTDIVSMMLQLNVGAHMAWRAPLAIRNMFQVFFVYPMVGERAFAYGLKHALTAEGKAEAVKAKIVGPDPVPFGDEIFNPFGTLSQIVRSGLKAYAKVDDYTRVVAYHATKFKVQAAGEKYLANNWNIAKFIEEAELNSTFHPIEAKQIADMVRSGNIPGAARRAGYLMQENTNFIYRAGNAPEAFRGVAGRLFGQFGMWPVSYIEYIRYLSTFGTPNQRASKIARFIAVNTAFGHAGTMLGVNTWKWLMFGPLVFTGGPMLQIAQDAGKVASALVQGRLDDDPEAGMAEARLKRNLPSTFIPGSGFVKDVEATLEEAKYGVRPAITRMLLGQSPQASFSALPPRGRRQEILRRLRSGQQKPPSR